MPAYTIVFFRQHRGLSRASNAAGHLETPARDDACHTRNPDAPDGVTSITLD